MKKITILFAALLLTILCYSQDKLTNESVIELTELGFGSDVIISKINSSAVNFDTSIAQLRLLKSKNVTPEVLSLMIDRSKIVIETGIFFSNNNILKKIEPAIFSGTKSSALGAMLTYGLVSAKVKSYINNANSPNKLSSNEQEFIFQFDRDSKTELGTGNWWFKTASSPNEFVLTSLNPQKNQRELVTGKANALAGSQIGIDSKNTIPYSIEDLGNGKYKVKPNAKLEKGEYCFFYQGSIPTGGYNNQSIFDFSVQ